VLWLKRSRLVAGAPAETGRIYRSQVERALRGHGVLVDRGATTGRPSEYRYSSLEAVVRAGWVAD
jgi:hypothetical protein